MEAILSPCVGVCTLNEQTGRCFGCGRSTEQIAMWPYYSDEQRRVIMQALDEAADG